MSAVATPKTLTAALGLDDLRQLMRSVNETTERLQHTHTALQGEVARLKAELAEANAQLRRSRTLAALGEMAAGIAHEVRNPLASIGLYAQILAEDLAAGRPPAEPVKLCGKIGRAVDRIDAIVRDVLRFAAEATPQTRPTTVGHLVARALEDCRSVLDRTRVTLIEPDDVGRSVELEIDEGLVVQALANVIRNAAQAMAETGGELRLEASRQRMRVSDGRAERIVIAVHDTGPGITDDVLKRMFNPFFTTRPTGTGLGLAIVHRIVEAHGGHVAVTNRSGGGATVALCLPVSPRTPPPKSPQPRSKE